MEREWSALTARLIERRDIVTDLRFAFLASGSVNFQANLRHLRDAEAEEKEVRDRMTTFLAMH